MPTTYLAPARGRLAYDLDGTTVFTVSGGVSTTVSAASINTQLATGSVSLAAGDSLVFLLPSTGSNKALARFLNLGVFGTSGTYNTFLSADTSDGINGSWGSYASGSVVTTNLGTTAPSDVFRTAPLAALGGADMHALRITALSAFTVKAVHIYAYWKDEFSVTGVQAIVWENSSSGNANTVGSLIDMGDIQRGYTALGADVTQSGYAKYLRNVHPTLTANSIVLSFDTLTPPPVGGVSEHQVRYNGGAWSSSVTIPSIGPLTYSALVETRRVTLSNASVGTWSYRLKAVVGSWT